MDIKIKIEKRKKMKDRRDLIKEYNMILRWTNGSSDEYGNVHPYAFYLEDLKTGKYIAIKNEEAINLIKKLSTNAFRNEKIYESHIKLFEVLNLKNKKIQD